MVIQSRLFCHYPGDIPVGNQAQALHDIAQALTGNLLNLQGISQHLLVDTIVLQQEIADGLLRAFFDAGHEKFTARA